MEAQAGPVVLAWEQGMNLGHVLRQRAIVDLLRRRGERPVWAVSESQAKQHWAAISATPCEKVVLRQANAPTWAARGKLKSFADVLASQGWTDAAWLTVSFRMWIELFRRLRPRAVVLDYAPVAQLAAFAMQMPCVHVSSGFDAPPGRCPPFSAPTASGAGLSKGESWDSIHAAIRQALSSGDASTRDAELPDILRFSAKVLDCVSQTDPYGPRSDVVYAPFVPDGSTLQPVNLPDGFAEGARRALAYLRRADSAHATFEVLKAMQLPAVFVSPGCDPARGSSVPRTMLLARRPVELSSVLMESTVFIGYGSVGLSSRAVLAGARQLLIPTDAEKAMVARRLASDGLGIALRPGPDGAESRSAIGAAMVQLHAGPEYADSCDRARKLSRAQAADFGVALNRLLDRLMR